MIEDEDGEEQQILRYNMPFGRVGAGRVRDLLHRLRAHARGDRADAHQHVRGQPARHHRPDPRLLHRGHGHAVLRAHLGLPRRPARRRAPARAPARQTPRGRCPRRAPCPVAATGRCGSGASGRRASAATRGQRQRPQLVVQGIVGRRPPRLGRAGRGGRRRASATRHRRAGRPPPAGRRRRASPATSTTRGVGSRTAAVRSPAGRRA